MDKKMKIVVAAIVIILLLVGAVVLLNSKKDDVSSKGGLGTIENAKDLEEIVSKVYDGIDGDLLPMVETVTIETTENDTVTSLTGLENGNDLEYLVVSQPMMNAQAYSFVLAKVKKGVDANKIAKQMSEKVDMARWICVEAEKLYATNSGDIICLIMSDNEKATAVYNSFKKVAGAVSKEYEKTGVVNELPPDMN